MPQDSLLPTIQKGGDKPETLRNVAEARDIAQVIGDGSHHQPPSKEYLLCVCAPTPAHRHKHTHVLTRVSHEWEGAGTENHLEDIKDTGRNGQSQNTKG